MAEFLTLEEGKSNFGSKGTANAGLTLGIIGTALGAMNSGFFGRNGILGGLGWGNNGYGNGFYNGAGAVASGIVGAEIAGRGFGVTPMEMKEISDQEFDLWELGKIRAEALQGNIFARERDIAEKTDIYKQTLRDNNRISDQVAGLKDFTVKGLSDVYQASVAENRVLERQISSNQLESYKNVSDLYATTVKSDKDLELQIERNREADQAEKFQLYKDLSDKNSALAYETMRQSYEDRMEAMNSVNALAARVCALEKDQAVTSAQLPLMFKLSESNTASAISNATCRKIDGNLTITPCQISTPFSPFATPFSFGSCGTSTWNNSSCGCGCGNWN